MFHMDYLKDRRWALSVPPLYGWATATQMRQEACPGPHSLDLAEQEKPCLDDMSQHNSVPTLFLVYKSNAFILVLLAFGLYIA